MVDRSRLARLDSPAYTCREFSSYNRASVAPDQPGWFANRDQNQFLRSETNDNGRVEHVMMDAKGPGAIVRWWITMAGPHSGKGTIRIYLDDSETPTIQGTPFDLISGGLLAGAPLSDSVSKATVRQRRGHNLYYPIPYSKSCKVTFERAGKGAFYYQINYRTYAPGTRVESWSPRAAEKTRLLLAKVLKILETRDRMILSNWKVQPLECELKPNASKEVLIQGPGAIRQILINLQGREQEQALRSTILKIVFDGEQTVWCPAGDFFGIGHRPLPYSSWYTQSAVDGTLGCWWVMPFARSAKIILENLGDQPVSVPTGNVVFSDWNWDEKSLYFHATWRQLYQIQTAGDNGRNIQPPNAQDINFVTIQGTGKYVGDTLVLFNTSNWWWGEGDEKIWVDDEPFPSHFGTGTEDYYGYAWCEHAEFDHPFLALPCGDGNGMPHNPSCPGYTVNSRWRSLDAIPFTRSLRFDMELWHWRKTWMNYAPSTFFYARPGAIVNVRPDPEQARLPVARSVEDVIPPANP